MKQKNPGNIRNRIIYTILLVVLLTVVFLVMINYAYREAEKSNSETLHVRTKEIKDDITLQMISDRENLTTIASMAEHLYGKAEMVYADEKTVAVLQNISGDIKSIAKDIYPEGYDYSILFESFESIGLINEIAIFFPTDMGDVYLTKAGPQIVKEIDFEEEAKKAPYISGRVPALTGPEREVIRSSVPIVAGGKTIGVLYGIVELDTLKNRYLNTVDNMNARLYIIERGNGNFIVDTKVDELGNFKDSKVLANKKGYSYDEMRNNIFAGGNGFCAYKSSISKVFMYAHYSPMEIGDWTIVLAVPEDTVFEDAYNTRDNLMLMLVAILVIMALYVAVMFVSEIKFSGIALTASTVRKHLLGVAGDKTGVANALKLIRQKCHGRTAFFADTVGNDFCHTDDESKIINGRDREYFHEELFKYIGKRMKTSNATLWVIEIVSELRIAKTNPEFYAFLKKHGINRVYIAAITDRHDRISVLGIVNSKRKYEAKELLKEVAICFSISVYNKDHLDRTEYEAVTDALTGISNRVAYKRDIGEIDKNIKENFACIYIDVNELHTYNNKYGHAAGDEMLIYIADAIKEVFGTYHVYRMGGDEFLIFTDGLPKETVNKKIEKLVSKVEEKGYHISIGMNYSIKNIDTESSMREAEKKMYDEKAKYYQQKELKNAKSHSPGSKMKFIETGDRDLDIMIKLLGGHYNGIYAVNLNTDVARRIIMPSYMDFKEEEENFSEIFKDYVSNYVHSDYQRGMFRFLNYGVLKGELENGDVPRFTYQKINGEYQVLTVYAQGEETLWVFENA